MATFKPAARCGDCGTESVPERGTTGPQVLRHREGCPAARHEPHGHCRVCHVGVHRYSDGAGRLSAWLHVNIPSTSAGQHLPEPVVTCCTEHGGPR